MAEALLRRALPGLSVDSAGTGALTGQPADREAVACMEEIGIDLSGHIARQLDAEMVREADYVLVATRDHKFEVERLHPWARGRVFRLGEWEGYDIEDPYRRGSEAFRRVRHALEACVLSWLPRLSSIHSSLHHPSRGIHV